MAQPRWGAGQNRRAGSSQRRDVRGIPRLLPGKGASPSLEHEAAGTGAGCPCSGAGASRRHELPGHSGCRLWQMQGEAPHSSLPSSSVTRVPGARQNQMWEHFPSDLFRRHWQESFNLFNLFPPALLLTLVQCRSRSSCDTPCSFPPPNSRAGRPGAFSEPPGLRLVGNRCSR